MGRKKHLTRLRRMSLLLAALWLWTAVPLSAEQAPALAEGTRALNRGEFEKAASLAGGYLKTHPTASEAQILLARAEMALGKRDSAFQRLQKVLRANPRNIDALYYLGWVCFGLSQIEHQKLYAMAPDSMRVHQLLAESYRAQENLTKAEEEYQTALKASPNSVEILDELGDLKRSQFQFDEAIGYYATALEIAPHDYVSTYGSGVAYLFKHQPQQAIEHLRRAVELDPHSPAARLALGDAFWRADQPAEAVRELKAATTLEPEMRQAYTLLARAYNKLGQSQEAREALSKAQELTRKDQERRWRRTLFGPDNLGPIPPPATAGSSQQTDPEE